MSEKKGEPLHVKGENAFAEKCNKFGCEHLHIRQERGVEFSDKMRQTGQKRPDFLVNIPDLTSLFVDVKVRDRKPAGDLSKILSEQRAVYVDYSDFLKMKELEKRMRICTWYAFIEQNGNCDIFGSPAYLIPLSRVEKHLPNHIMEKMKNDEKDVKWEIRIPFHCMNEWGSAIDLRDKCQGCTELYCEIFPK